MPTTATPPPKYFDAALPLFEARAPGRLDVMGGISDYSGGLCLEWPLECATTCTVQLSDTGRLEAYSANAAGEGWNSSVGVDAVDFLQTPLDQIQTRFFNAPGDRWAAYVLGALAVLNAHGLLTQSTLKPDFGVRLFLDSDVPTGAGVSSSASVEVATMASLNKALQLDLDGATVATLCQQVENEIAGAPCGIMDQMTIAVGRQNHLLRLLCQPAVIEGYVALPAGVQVWAIDSGAKHAVGGGAYGRARAATMMGRRILRDVAPDAMCGPDGQLYLANVSVDVWRALRESVPETLSGAEFTNRFGGHEDPVTTVEADQSYAVRLATEHPIYEADRARRFARLLEQASANPQAREPLLRAAGELMIQSHFSYEHRCNLGAPETDLIVKMARERGPQLGIYGAKITGGGAGGAVAILADSRVNSDLQRGLESLRSEYETATGNTSRLLSGSSDGALA